MLNDLFRRVPLLGHDADLLGLAVQSNIQPGPNVPRPVTIKTLSDSKVTQLYMRHVNGIVFRLLGETFAYLPTIEEIVLSGYSQRPNKATGQIQDEYLYSVKVTRDAWSKLDFTNLSAIDVAESLGQFELRREMTKNGRFSAIEPYIKLASQTGLQ